MAVVLWKKLTKPYSTETLHTGSEHGNGHSAKVRAISLRRCNNMLGATSAYDGPVMQEWKIGRAT
jgi:hypothetical protein